MRPPLEVDPAPTPLVVNALARTGLIPVRDHARARWQHLQDPCAVVAWAVRQVQHGRADARWLIGLLRSVDPTVRAQVERLDLFLAAIEDALDGSADDSRSVARGIATVEQLVWFLTVRESDDDVEPFPGLRRVPEHLRWTTGHLMADLTQVTGLRWVITIGPDGLLHVDLDGIRRTTDVGTTVDPERLVWWAEPPEVDESLRWESLEALFDPVQEAFYQLGTHIRCRQHGKQLFPCCGEWVCEGHTVHQFARMGELVPETVTWTS